VEKCGTNLPMREGPKRPANPMTKPLKVGVMGAGAIGCFVGGQLAARGVSVVLVGRERLRAEIEATGLVLKDLDGATTTVREVGFALDASALADCGVVLCCVKSPTTAKTGEALAPVLARGAVVVSLQNGVRNSEVLRSHLPKQTVLGAVVGFNVVAPGAGVFRRTTSGPLVIQESSEECIAALAKELRSRFEVELVRDIRAFQYAKLVMNVNNAVGALSDVPTRDLLFEPGYRRIIAALMGEALGVMRSAGIRPARLGPLPPWVLPLALRLPTPLLRLVARAQLKIDPEARSSMWDDLSKGRLTEVDDLNGEIVHLAETSGVKAPLNQRVVELVHEVEKSAAGSPKLSAAALWAALHRP